MRILVLGSGMMGPAAAYNSLLDSDVEEVTLADNDMGKLAQAQEKLGTVTNTGNLSVQCVDVADTTGLRRVIAQHDVVISALPRTVIALGAGAAIDAGTPLVDLDWPAPETVAELRQRAAENDVLLLFGCGVEPGLTEIVARYLAEKLDRVEELHIKCGGVPAVPKPPLGYKIVFGGRQLPLKETEAHTVVDGELQTVARYSGVEPVFFDGVGECEAWHEGFMPWLLELDSLRGLQVGTQKTVRWPGYADKVTTLREMGLLADKPIQLRGASVVPKEVLDEVLRPRVTFSEEDRDITLFRVEAVGSKKKRPRRYRVDMVDRYDEEIGFTSMARVTAFTGAIIARMVGSGAIQATGLHTPEELLFGRHFRKLLRNLAAANIQFELTTEKKRQLR